MANSKTYDHLFKILMIGDSSVGKTSILGRLAMKNFSQSFVSTIGIDFKIHTIELDGKKVKLQIWDTAGQERFRTITTSYYRGAMGIMLVYDITCAESFYNIRTWIGNVNQHANADAERMLLGNKSDVSDLRTVPREQAEKLAGEYHMRFVECSANTGANIDEAFTLMARDIKAKLERRSEAAAAAGGDAGIVLGGNNGIGRLRKHGGGNRKFKCGLL